MYINYEWRRYSARRSLIIDILVNLCLCELWKAVNYNMIKSDYKIEIKLKVRRKLIDVT